MVLQLVGIVHELLDGLAQVSVQGLAALCGCRRPGQKQGDKAEGLPPEKGRNLRQGERIQPT
jgi:hypothetical protein